MTQVMLAGTPPLTHMRGDIGFDLETTGLNPRVDRIVMVSLKPRGLQGHYMDVRQMDGSMLRALLAPYLDSPDITLVGHNLLFDLLFLAVKLDLFVGRSKLWDTQQVALEIMGIGSAEAGKSPEKRVSLGAVAARYGLAVSKEERQYFIGLDRRIEGQRRVQVGSHTETDWYLNGELVEENEFGAIPLTREVPDFGLVGGTPAWDLPIPAEQYAYARQDVSVVHPMKQRQERQVAELGLQEVVDLEMAALPAEVIKSYWGVRVDRERCGAVVCAIKEEADKLEVQLHEMLDTPILEARKARYMPLFESYMRWLNARERAVAFGHRDWCNTHELPNEHKKHVVGWGQEKKRLIDEFEERHPRRVKPTPNKETVSLGSGQQLKDGLAHYGVVVTNVQEDTLRAVAHNNPVVQVYLEWKKHNTFLSKYGGDTFLGLLDKYGRIYPEWKQKAANTGREGCARPNLQQFPRVGIGAGMRACIIPAEGYCFIGADFDSEELRIIAGRSGDESMSRAFASGESLHVYTALLMFGIKDIPVSEAKAYTKSHNVVLRGKELPNTPLYDVAKTCNYALFYGAGAGQLSNLVGCDVEDAKQLKSLHYRTFKTAMDWVRSGRNVGYARTASGRICRFSPPDMQAICKKLGLDPGDPTIADLLTNKQRWEEAKEVYRRQQYNRELSLANAPVQGTGSDIMKRTMGSLYREFGYDVDIRLILTVHDEAILEVRDDAETIRRAAEGLKWAMEEAQERYMGDVAIGLVNPVKSYVWEH